MIGATSGWAQVKGPVKIGFITTLTGPMAANGKDMLAGLQVYLDEIGYQVAGRKIELIVEDDEANPAVALTKGKKTRGEGWGPRHVQGADGSRPVMPSRPTSTPKRSPRPIRSWRRTI